EATLDFPEEEIDFLQKADAYGQLDRLQAQLGLVLARTQQGALLREGIKVVIAGQPNAGKSSLLNALAGAELAIVTPIAGTTRDKVQQTIQIDGVPLHVIDTAGLRDSQDEVERIGIARAWDEIAAADAVLFLHDLSRSGEADYAAADLEIAQTLAERILPSVPVIDLWNKTDLAAPGAQMLPLAPLAGRVGSEESLSLSARTGAGLDAVRRRLLQVAGWQSAAEGLYIARARHVEALQAVGAHLQEAHDQLNVPGPALDILAEELRLAQQALNSITGEFTSDDLLGVIFSSFCIGK
ncbi:MAG: GTPase, partial [Comamonas sp.]